MLLHSNNTLQTRIVKKSSLHPQLLPYYDYSSMNMSYAPPKILPPNLVPWKEISSEFKIYDKPLPISFGCRYLGSNLLAHGTPSILDDSHALTFLSKKYSPTITSKLSLPFPNIPLHLKLNFHASFIQCYSNLFH